MSKIILFLCITLLIFSNKTNAQYRYPATKEVPIVDDYFGTMITDNYRWLEDIKNTDVQNWFKSQSEFSDSVIGKIKGREMLYSKMKEVQKMGGDMYGKICQNGSTYYYTKIKKYENLSKLYCRMLPNGQEQLIFDPETFEKGTQLMDYVVDEAGSKVAFSLSKGGAEVGEIRVLDLLTKKILNDVIGPLWSEFPFEFTKKGTAILYTKMSSADNTSDDLLKNMKVCEHTLGSEAERIIASREKNKELNILPEQFLALTFSDDKKYIFLNIHSVKQESIVYYASAADFDKPAISWKPLMTFED